MKYILVLHFMGVHVVYDLPNRAECNNKASDLARTLHYRATDSWSTPGFDFYCSPQTPESVEFIGAVYGQPRQPR